MYKICFTKEKTRGVHTALMALSDRPMKTDRHIPVRHKERGSRAPAWKITTCNYRQCCPGCRAEPDRLVLIIGMNPGNKSLFEVLHDHKEEYPHYCQLDNSNKDQRCICQAG
jgi:hypothetical protein